MALKLPDDQKGPSRWTMRFALFAVSMVAFAVICHRLLGMPTPVAINIVAGAFAVAGIAIVTGLFSTARIWRLGTGGGLATLFGMVVAGGLLAWPVAFLPTMRSLPRINDITTDVKDPPRFAAVLKARPANANALTYSAKNFAVAQEKAYSDLRTMQVDRSAEETYELVLAALNTKTMKLKTTAEEAPKGRYGQPGFVELVDRTLILGFTDDVVIRVDGDAKTSKVDLRSVSRYGSHDLGRNAQRIRRILKEIQAQIEATAPNADGQRPYRLKGRGLKAPVPKRQPGGDQTSGDRRNGQALSKSDAQRGPAPKDKRPSQDARQGPGTRG